MSEMGAERTANVVLTADVEQYNRQLVMAAGQTKGLTGQLENLARGFDKVTKSAGGKLQLFGGTLLGGLTAASTAAALFEKRMSNLQATAAITNKSFDTMANSVNKLRREFPIATQEAGMLVDHLTKIGDGTSSVNKLADTFVKLGAATGESTMGLTNGLIQLERTMGNNQSQTTKFANVLTELSHSSGVSAQGIIEFSQAIAPIGRVAGMSTQEVMGVSTAFSKAGQDGYLAANAFNKMLNDIMQSVITGNPDLAKYSNLIGVTVEQFQKMDKTVAITKVFEELNRMGPQAIQVLNRMGLDGMRTLKSITAVTQQSGGIGAAVAEAQKAYGEGGLPTSALEKGSKAAMGGLVDEMTRLKNTMAQMGETIGKPIVDKVLTPMARAFNTVAKEVEQTLRPIASLVAALTGLMGIGGGVVGTLLKFATPLASIAAGVGLMRSFGAGGFIGGYKAMTGGTIEPGSHAWFSQRAYQQGNMNIIGRGTYLAGTNLGGALGLMSSRIGGFLPPVTPGVPGAPTPSLASRMLGVPAHLLAGGLRLANMQYEDLWHPYDTARKSTFLPRGSLSQIVGGLAKDESRPGVAAAAARAQSGFADIKGWAAGHSRWASERLGVPYFPQPERMPQLMGGHQWKGMFDGFSSGLKNATEGAKQFGAGTVKATAGLATLMAKTGAPALGRGIGAMGGSLMSFMGGPWGVALAGGIGLYTLAAKHAAEETPEFDKKKTSMMDTYAKAVGTATTATHSFAGALQDAIEQLTPKTREQALTVRPKEAQFVTGDEYEYTSKFFEKEGGAKATKDLLPYITQAMGGPEGEGAPKEVIEAIKLDLLKRTGGDRYQVTKMLKEAEEHRGEFDVEAAMKSFFDLNNAFQANVIGMNKSTAEYLEEMQTTMGNQRNVAYEMAGREGEGIVARSQLAGVFRGLATQEGTWEGVGATEMDRLEEFINERFFGGQASIGGRQTGWDQIRSPKTLDIEQYIRGGEAKTPKEAMFKFLEDAIEVTKEEDESTYEGVNGLLQSMNLSRKRMQTLLKEGKVEVPVRGGGTRTITKEDLWADSAKSWDQVQAEALGYVSASEQTARRVRQAGNEFLPGTPGGLMGRMAAGGREPGFGDLIMGNRAVQRALDKPGDINKQIVAVNEMVNEMRKGKITTAEFIGGLTRMKEALADPTDPLHALANAAIEAAKSLSAIKLAFASPGQRLEERGPQLMAEWDAVKNSKTEEGAKARERIITEARDEIIAFGQQIKQWYVAENEFQIQRKQQRDDFNLTRKRQDFEYNLSRERNEYDFNLARERATYDFNLARRRGEFEFNVQRSQALFDYNLQRYRAEYQYQLMRTRAEEDYQRTVDRFKLQQKISEKDAIEDYYQQRKWSEEDFQHQVKLMTEQAARDMYNIYERVNVQRTWSASNLLQNANDQLQRMQEQAANLDKLRQAGVSSDVIKALDFTNPQNAQQVARFVGDIAQDPSLVKAWNEAIAARLKAAEALVQDEDNIAWEEMNRSFNLQMERSQIQFEKSLARNRRNAKISLAQMAEDFKIQKQRSADDHATTMKWMANDFNRQMNRSLQLHKRQLAQQLEDFNTVMERQLQDHKELTNRQQADYNRSTNQQIADFEKNMARARDAMDRQAEYMTMSLAEIVKAANTTLTGVLADELETFKAWWKDLKPIIRREAVEIRDAVNAVYGLDVGANRSTPNPPSATSPSGVSGQGSVSRTGTKPGIQNNAEGGIYPGYTPGKDIGLIGVSGGEAIMRPEWTVAVGPQKVHEMNRTAKVGGVQAVKAKYLGGMATGGMVSPAGGFMPSNTYLDTGGIMGGDNARVIAAGGTGAWDFPVPIGTPVHAAWAGRVTKILNAGDRSYGLYMALWHQAQNVGTLYAHLSKVLVGMDAVVSQGQVIARSGNSGPPGMGAHLHFEITGNVVRGINQITGMNYAPIDNPIKESYPFEKQIDKMPFGRRFFGDRDVVSKHLNWAIRQYAKNNNIDLSSWPTAARAAADDGSWAHFDKAGTHAKNILLGKQMAAARGWTGDKWEALYTLWDRESNWNHQADNPSSSAYGIPQGLVETHNIPKPYWGTRSGSGPRANFTGGDPRYQINWGLNYIANRYGGPIRALRYHDAHNSYGDGAVFTGGPQDITVAERGPEAVIPLNHKGAEFLAELMAKYAGVETERKKNLGFYMSMWAHQKARGQEAQEAKRINTVGTSVPMKQNNYYDYRYDYSTNFTGPVSVAASDPREMAEQLRIEKRRRALTHPLRNAS